jgi:hypothetical protein
MIPQKGQYVKAIFYNSIQVEGFVQEWSDKQATLKTDDGRSFFCISNVQDVMAVKIMIEEIASPPKQLYVLEQEFQEVQALPSKESLRIKKLAQLKKMMIEEEKKIVSNKIREHIPSSGIKGVQYGSIFQK